MHYIIYVREVDVQLFSYGFGMLYRHGSGGIRAKAAEIEIEGFLGSKPLDPIDQSVWTLCLRLKSDGMNKMRHVSNIC